MPLVLGPQGTLISGGDMRVWWNGRHYRLGGVGKEVEVYSGCKIYGPYTRKDGRQHVCVIWPDASRSTVSFPKYMMETYLGRYLLPEETIDHIDRDVQNNAINNLRILSRKEHVALDISRIKEQNFVCPVCEKTFILSGNKVSRLLTQRSRGKSKTGPYCGKPCAGKGSSITSIVERVYFTYKSLEGETLQLEGANSGNLLVGNPELGESRV
jgi:hypothetical protein